MFMDSGIVAEHGADWMTKVSAGTGPFKFKQWRRGVSVDLDADPYWGGAPKIDGVSFLIVPNADTALRSTTRASSTSSMSMRPPSAACCATTATPRS